MCDAEHPFLPVWVAFVRAFRVCLQSLAAFLLPPVVSSLLVMMTQSLLSPLVRESDEQGTEPDFQHGSLTPPLLTSCVPLCL